MLFFPSLAQAHAILVESAPPLDANIPAGITRLLLRFNSRIDHARSRLTLADKAALPLLPAGPAGLAADVTLTPGPQVVRWQVLATDGHVTRGELRFTVAP